MLRRLHPEQPESFAFTPANQAWAEGQITKYPEGREASAIIPLLWRAQEQEGWLTRPAIEHVAEMLDMAYIRALEVASFYFMFQLQPTGSVAHVQVCGTTTCMICGAEDLIAVCKDKISPKAHGISADGKLSWEEVECLGSCANAPMAQIGKDYYEDLTAEGFAQLLDDLVAGKVPVPGPQNGRYASEAADGPTNLKDHVEGRAQYNASVARAVEIGDTVKRIDGTEVPLLTPWLKDGTPQARDKAQVEPAGEEPAPTERTVPEPAGAVATPETRPEGLDAPRDGQADDLKLIKGVGPKLEELLNSLGFYHFDQIAGWTEAEIHWVDQNLEGFKGRVTRDEWVSQAKLLAAGEETDFARKAKDEGIYDDD
ncbi:NADH-quinone oxidoreductase subunit NuoE [Marinibacterium sp. SX1]|uniref:NADH-quinone oxidoreductase subunit NuoE n=1 Tax=Marinibacterium sp. SX1 TaxID=3388424 RepID=UPI003D164FF0